MKQYMPRPQLTHAVAEVTGCRANKDQGPAQGGAPMSESAARPHGGLIDNLYYDAMAIPAQVRLLP